MKRKKSAHVPASILTSSSDPIQLIHDIKKLTVEDVVVMFAYAEAIVETVREPLIILDGELRIKTANKSFFETFKVTKEQTYNELIFHIGNGQWNIPELKVLLKEILPKDAHFDNFEVEHDFEDIGKKIMLLNARRIVLEGNKTELILLAIEDVTIQRAYEQKLQQSEQHYRSVVDQVKDYIIYTMNKEGLITDWNSAAEAVIGYKKEEVVGKFHDLIYTQEDRKKQVPANEIKGAARDGINVNERWHVRKDRTQFWGSGVVSPLLDEQKNLLGFSKVMRDITVQKEQAVLKDEFLSIASHELKTPVTTIKAYTQLLMKRLANTPSVGFLNTIDKQANKLVTLIEDLLDVSKIEAGKLVFTYREVDLDALIQRLMVDYQYMTETHTITKLGEVKRKVIGDEERLEQVMINLLTNAIKYSPNGKEVIIRVTEKNNQVCVSVQDFGIGIAKNNQQSIFEKYYQVTENGQQGKKGFGLGLFICSEIISRHQGTMSVESTKGKGSTFTFCLPLIEPASSAA